MVKTGRIVCGCAALALAQSVLADEPTLSAQALGTVEGIVNFCAQVDPKAATRYQEQVKLLVQGAPEETVAEVRMSDAYRQAYDSVADAVSKGAERDAMKACRESLAQNK